MIKRLVNKLRRKKPTPKSIEQANLRHKLAHREGIPNAVYQGILGSIGGVAAAKTLGAHPLVGAALGIPAALNAYTGAYQNSRMTQRAIYGNTHKPRVILSKGPYNSIEAKASKTAPKWMKMLYGGKAKKAQKAQHKAEKKAAKKAARLARRSNARKTS